MPTLLLIRHGESEWNRAGRIQGQVDTPLTAAGIAQAQAIGKHLAGLLANTPLTVYSSPLSRARATAAVIAEHLGRDPAAVNVEQRLNDFDQGDISGTQGWDTVAERFPELARLRLQNPLEYHPPGGESGAAFQSRLQAFLDDLPDDGAVAILVSHGIANKYIRSIKRGISGAGIIALGESQNTVYRLDDERETEIIIDAY